MLSVGIDAHDRLYVMCILDHNGRRVKERTVRGPVGEVAAAVLEAAQKFGQPARVCYEASLGYGLLYDALAPVAAEIKVAHTAHLRAIYAARTKNDRIDAFKLARAIYLDQVPEIHVPSAHVRDWRGLIEHRERLVARRTACKNALRSILRANGMDAPRGNKLWTKAGLTWLSAREFDSPFNALRRDQLLLELELLSRSIAATEKMLDGVGTKHSGVTLLKTIPGVGPRTSEAVVAYADNPHRFATTTRAASYFGLVPRLDQSAGVKRYGHITRQGPPTVRRLLVEAAWQAIRKDAGMRAFFERVKGGKKERTGIAIVATAHRLVKIMIAMLKSGEEWRATDQNATPQAKKEALVA